MPQTASFSRVLRKHGGWVVLPCLAHLHLPGPAGIFEIRRGIGGSLRAVCQLKNAGSRGLVRSLCRSKKNRMFDGSCTCCARGRQPSARRALFLDNNM